MSSSSWPAKRRPSFSRTRIEARLSTWARPTTRASAGSCVAAQRRTAAALSVAWVVAAQGICGVAKDLTKTASKSAIKVAEKEARAENAEGRLFRWVAWFTGSKNAMKGFGFFLGGVLLQVLGFRLSLWVMACALALILAGVVLSLPPMMGKSKASASARELFGKSRGVNLLVVRPGPVATPFHANAVVDEGGVGYRPPGHKAQSPDEVATKILRAVDRGDEVLETSLFVKASSAASRLAPAVFRRVARAMARRSGF